MSKNTWDAVLASVPLNATAGRVTSKGEEYRSGHVQTEMQWDGPPKMVRHIPDATHPDLTGRKVGRLTVIGKLAWRPGNNTMWVCRCTCGKYVGRRSKGLKNPRCTFMACQECDYAISLRERLAAGNNARERAADTTKRRWTLP